MLALAAVDLGELAAQIVDSDRVASAAVIAASVRRGECFVETVGLAGKLSYADEAAPVEEGTYFDWASVTKPVTALLAARLVRHGVFSWQTPLGDWLEEARGTPSEAIPIELFFAHRAGLEAHRFFYAPLVEGKDIDKSAVLVEAASARRADCLGATPAIGFPPRYSDLGYLLVGEAMARICGEPLDALMHREVCKPLGLGLGSARQLRERDPAFDERVAATETVDWRGGTIVGAVHDDNAWALGRDGACGHAGLFGTAADLVGLGQAILDAMKGRRDDWLTAYEIDVLVRPREGGTLRAGFDGKSDSGSSTGRLFGPRSIGHLGFTGTSLWMDPERELVCVLLTNRVHPSRESQVIREVRPRVHDAVARWADRS